MNAVALIPANPAAVQAVAARYNCAVPMDLQVGIASLAKALRISMQQTTLYATTPPPDQLLTSIDYDAPLETTAHPYVIAATLHNLAQEFDKLTAGPIAIPNDVMIFIGDEWKYVANMVADRVNITPPGASAPAPAPTPPPPGTLPHVATAVGHMEGSAPGVQNLPRTDPAIVGGFLGATQVGGLPEITLSPEQKGASPGRPRKSLFESEIALRVKGYSLPTWWPEFRDQAPKVFTHTPANAIYTAGSRKSSPPQTYMLLLELLQNTLVTAPQNLTVAELLTWIRGVEQMVAQSPSAPAIEQFRKALRDMTNKGDE
jgi:hypothetical protein